VHAVYPGEFAERSAKGDDTPPYAPDVMYAYPSDPWYGIWPLPMDRHQAHTNALFRDGSVRKVGVKELWTLKWHRRFDTAGPWTSAGGVRPGDWPEWMRKFQDY